MRAEAVVAALFLCIAVPTSQADGRSQDDRTFSNVYRVFKTEDDGSAGTLRWAILQANQSPGLDKIVIDGRGNQPFVIKPNSLLPVIQGPLVIEGDRDWRTDRSRRDRGPDTVVDGSNFIDTSTIQSCPGENPAQFGPNVRTVQRPGLAIVDTEGVEIFGLEVRNFCIGILVWRSKNNFVHHNRLVNNIGGAGVLLTGDDGAGGATVGLTINNVVVHNVFIDNGDGLELTRGSDQNLVAHNTFTMTPSGLTPSQGIETINSSENRIVWNRFSNFSDGIQMNGGNRNYITRNYITGNTNGITLSGDGHIVSRNLIRGNRLGIGPTAGNHRLTENSIFNNGQDIILCNAGGTLGTPPACNPAYPQLGIDLHRDGVTPNDLAVMCADGFPDCDTGANGRQNFPVLLPPTLVGSGALIVRGALASRPNQVYVIEVFANRKPGVVNGVGEGELFVGAAKVVTDPNGNAVFSLPLSPTDVLEALLRRSHVKGDDRDRSTTVYLTATATDDATGGTSEFSQAVAVRFSAGTPK